MPGDLYYGDNLDILRRDVPSESVDLIYLDPPFNSQRTYSLIHRRSRAQQKAFFDTWRWDDQAEIAYGELTGRASRAGCVPQELSDIMTALRAFLWRDHRNVLAYLSMMAVRLAELRRVLRPTGTICLHCDPTASHYLKIVLDSIFGVDRFENEIVWQRSTGKALQSRRLPNNHDVILFYGKGNRRTWNPDETFAPYDHENLDERTLRQYARADADGRRYTLGDLINPNLDRPNLTYEFLGIRRVWRWTKDRMHAAHRAGLIVQSRPGAVPRIKRYLDEQRGKPMGDVWTDIPPLSSHANERLGYPTQKPVALLERIVRIASRPGDVVLDPFCGCGTTIEVAEALGRRWIGIDVAIRAVDVVKERLDEKFARRVWTEHGEPSDIEQAAHLAEARPYDFLWWAVRMLGGEPLAGEKKKGRNDAIDGEMTFQERGTAARRAIISVKGGRRLTPDDVKALETTVHRQKADYGILLSMHEPPKGTRDAARACGSVPCTSGRDGKLEERIRLVTVGELLAGTAKLPPGENLTRVHGDRPTWPEICAFPAHDLCRNLVARGVGASG